MTATCCICGNAFEPRNPKLSLVVNGKARNAALLKSHGRS